MCGQAFVVAVESPPAVQPGQGAFHHPTAWQHLERAPPLGFSDDLECDSAVLPGPGNQLARVAAVGQISAIDGIAIRARSRTARPPSRSRMLAAVTSTTISSPSVSTTTCLVRPLTFLPASYRVFNFKRAVVISLS